MPRPEWDDVRMTQAYALAKKARCVRKQIGCVIVTVDQRVVSEGYAGPPFALPLEGEYCDTFCPRVVNQSKEADYSDCLTIHAENNALIRANWDDMREGTLYVTSIPCWNCAKMVSNTLLKRVVCHDDVDAVGHRNPIRSLDLLRDSGLEVLLYA